MPNKSPELTAQAASMYHMSAAMAELITAQTPSAESIQTRKKVAQKNIADKSAHDLEVRTALDQLTYALPSLSRVGYNSILLQPDIARARQLGAAVWWFSSTSGLPEPPKLDGDDMSDMGNYVRQRSYDRRVSTYQSSISFPYFRIGSKVLDPSGQPREEHLFLKAANTPRVVEDQQLRSHVLYPGEIELLERLAFKHATAPLSSHDAEKYYPENKVDEAHLRHISMHDSAGRPIKTLFQEEPSRKPMKLQPKKYTGAETRRIAKLEEQLLSGVTTIKDHPVHNGISTNYAAYDTARHVEMLVALLDGGGVEGVDPDTAISAAVKLEELTG